MQMSKLLWGLLATAFVSSTTAAGLVDWTPPPRPAPDPAPKREPIKAPELRPIQEVARVPPEVVEEDHPVAEAPEKKAPRAVKKLHAAAAVRHPLPNDVDLTTFSHIDPAPIELTSNDNDIRHAVRRRITMFRDCYESQLKTDSELKGKLGVNLDIGQNGRVDSLSFSDDTMQSRELRRCIRRRSMQWRFDKPSHGAVRVAVALSFGTADDRVNN